MQEIAVDTRPLRWAGATSVTAAAALTLVPAALACPLRAATGVPCPLCGATRGVGDLLRGDIPGALAHNPASVLLVIGVLVLFVVALRRVTLRVPVWVPMVVLAALWAFQLFKYTTGRPL